MDLGSNGSEDELPKRIVDFVRMNRRGPAGFILEWYQMDAGRRISRLLDRAQAGDATAVRELFSEHRDRLRRFVSARLDPRIAARVDASDVVQETLATAHSRLDRFLLSRPMSFYPWLRQIAMDRLIDFHRRHVSAQCRSIARESQLRVHVCDDSAEQLLQFAANQASPDISMMRGEVCRRVSIALESLPDMARDALVLRFVEQLTTKEAAEVMGVSVTAFQGRQLRALSLFRRHLQIGSDDLD